MKFFGAIRNSFCNTLRNSSLSPAEKKNRANASTICSIIKIGAVAVITTSIALSILALIVFPTVWMTLSLISFTFVSILSIDLYVLANRTQNMLDNAYEELKYLQLRNPYDQVNFISKNTLLIGPFLQLAYRKKV